MMITTRRCQMTLIRAMFGQLFPYGHKHLNSSLQRMQQGLELWCFDRLIWVLVWRSTKIWPLLCNDS